MLKKNVTCEAVFVIASMKSCLVLCYTRSREAVRSFHQAGGVPCFEWEHLQSGGAPFSACMFCIKKGALLICLARAGLFLRTKAISHRIAASSGHRQKIVGGRIKLNEEMEKAINRQGFMQDTVKVASDFPVCIEVSDCSRK